MKKNNYDLSSLNTTLLAIAFIVLKLCGIIDWSWWWVLSPFWIPVSLAILLFGIVKIYEMINNKYKNGRTGKKTE